LRPVDALDQGDPELAVVDAPDLHARVRVVGPHVVDAIDERAALDLDVEPRPLLDLAVLDRVRDVVDLLEMCHDVAPESCGSVWSSWSGWSIDSTRSSRWVQDG